MTTTPCYMDRVPEEILAKICTSLVQCESPDYASIRNLMRTSRKLWRIARPYAFTMFDACPYRKLRLSDDLAALVKGYRHIGCCQEHQRETIDLPRLPSLETLKWTHIGDATLMLFNELAQRNVWFPHLRSADIGVDPGINKTIGSSPFRINGRIVAWSTSLAHMFPSLTSVHIDVKYDIFGFHEVIPLLELPSLNGLSLFIAPKTNDLTEGLIDVDIVWEHKKSSLSSLALSLPSVFNGFRQLPALFRALTQLQKLDLRMLYSREQPCGKCLVIRDFMPIINKELGTGLNVKVQACEIKGHVHELGEYGIRTAQMEFY